MTALLGFLLFWSIATPIDPAGLATAPATPALPSAPPPAAQPVPAEPAPIPIQSVPVPAPQTKEGFGIPALVITAKLNYPILRGGNADSYTATQTLRISGERALALRQQGKITTSLKHDLERFLAPWTKPQDARFERLGEQWVVMQRNGFQADLAATQAQIVQALKDPGAPAPQVVWRKETPPQRTLAFFQERGITTFYATGASNYYGSSPARTTNIHVGASRFKDLLFEGHTFSFNQVVGPIDEANGFVAGLVIAGDQTASGVGGGICQVSTTVFRALFGAGLPIVQRQNHSYQVYFYKPQGLDATIFQPNLDLKFKNDSGGPLWFQTEWDDKEADLTISVFGRRRDFEVKVDQPRVLRTSPPPPNRLIPDATLWAGQTKQIDWAAPGASVEVTRHYLRAGRSFKQEKLTSQYRPWPNIFKVGTRQR